MVSTILSSLSYLNYLNDYIDIILNYTDQGLVDHLNEPYFDEIEAHARFILTQWYNEQVIDKQSSFYIENVGYLNRKIALLTQTYRLNSMQYERIEDLLCNDETTQLIISIIKSLVETNLRHKDNFLRHLSILIDSFSLMKHSKTVFNQITQQVIESEYYQQYLTELLTSEIQSVHLCFIGAIGQLASSVHHLILNELYSQILTRFYKQKSFSNNIDLHYCTLGILLQLDISFLINDHSCLSTLMSMFCHISSNNAEKNVKIFLLPIFHLFNSVCIESKTAACYLNTDQLIDVLLHYVTHQNNYRIHIQACLLLGHVISEKQLNERRIVYKLTMKLMDLFLYDKNETNNILHSFLSLAIHEQVQFTIVHTYQLINFIQSSKQYPVIDDIIWKLSFHADIVEQLILRHDAFLKQLALLTTSPAANGILQNVQMKNSSHSPPTDGVLFDFSLVSSPKDHLIVQEIEENLLKNNLHAGTITNSRSILLCVSEESKHDCTCQAAIRQAVLDCKKIFLCVVQKPYRLDDWFSTLHIPDGKLLNMMETGVEKIIFEVQKGARNNFHLPAIEKRTRIITPPHRNSQTNFTLSPPPALPSATPAKKIQNWTNRQVLAWCETNKLNAFMKILTLYDGRSLLALAHVSRMSAPHTIINQLRNDCRKQGLRVSFVEFIRFQTALDDLLRLEKSMTRKQSISTLASRYVYRSKLTHQT